MISNKTYDLLKNVVTVVLPATATLYVTLASLWGFPNPEAVAGTFAALATFGGVVMRISTKKWDASDDKFDGELVMTGYDEDTNIPNLQLNISGDPAELVQKGTVILRSIDET